MKQYHVTFWSIPNLIHTVIIKAVVYWLQIVIAGKPEIVSRFQAPWHDWVGREVGSWDGNRDAIQQLPHQVSLKGTGHNGCSETIVARLDKIVTRFWTAVTCILVVSVDFLKRAEARGLGFTKGKLEGWVSL